MILTTPFKTATHYTAELANLLSYVFYVNIQLHTIVRSKVF